MTSDDHMKRKGKRAPRWLRVGLIVSGVVVVLLLLTIFVLPTPLARYFIQSQLTALGIESDGTETIEVDLWNSHVRAGPLRFHGAETRDGEIGDVSFDYSVRQLLDGKAFVRTFSLRGIDLYIARREDGSIELNGVNLLSLGRASQDSAEEESPTDDEQAQFHFGVEGFEFTDSKLVFEDVTGGVLSLDLQRLILDNLRSWTPDEPTTFALEGRLNEMQVSLDGTVIPLSDPLRVTLNSAVQGVTMERLARFVGPTGLARQEGSLDSRVHYDFSFHRDGRIEAMVDGSYRLSDLAITTATGEELTIEGARLALNVQTERRPDETSSAVGSLKLQVEPLSLSAASGDGIRLGSIDLNFDDLDFRKSAEKRRTLLDWTPADSTGGAAAGTADGVIDLAIGQVVDLARAAIGHYVELDGRPRLVLEDGVLRNAARGGEPGRELRFDRLTMSLGDVTNKALDAGWQATMGLDTTVQGMHAALDGDAGEARVTEARMVSRAIDLSVTTETAKLAFDLSTVLKTLAASNPEGASLALDTLSLSTDGMSVSRQGDKREATGPLVLEMEALEASLRESGGADGKTAMSAKTLALRLSPVSLNEGEAASISFTGGLEATGLSVAREGQDPLSIALAEAGTDFQDLRVSPLGADAGVEGGLAARLAGLTLEARQEDGALSLSLDSAKAQAGGLQASGFDADPRVSVASGLTALTGFSGDLPIGGGRKLTTSLEALEAPFSDLVLRDQNVRGAGGLDISGIAMSTGKEARQSVNIARLLVKDLTGGSAEGAEMASISLEELVASLTLPFESVSGDPSNAQAAAPGQSSEGADGRSPHEGLRLKVGEFSVSAGSRIAITDSAVEPPLKVNVVVEVLKAGPLDTAAPQARTNLSLATSLNKTSRASLEGWASPLLEKPGFDLSASLDSVSLPTISPYAASIAGVDIESGVLNAQAKAAASNAALQGKVDLRIQDLFILPVSQESAENLKSTIGVPVGFAVGLLKNSEGVIELGLPVSGTLDAPEVDYSEAISKAVSGAIASVFPTNWFGPGGNEFSMQPATFVAGTAELTKDGKAVVDQIGAIMAAKKDLRIRACGRAARADLVVLRGGKPEPVTAPVPVPGGETPAGDSQAAQQPSRVSPPVPPLAEPDAGEKDALLALASERGAAVRQYLQSNTGISPERIPECRTTYSLKEGKEPRAEFQF